MGGLGAQILGGSGKTIWIGELSEADQWWGLRRRASTVRAVLNGFDDGAGEAREANFIRKL